jgi:hypothetical protein
MFVPIYERQYEMNQFLFLVFFFFFFYAETEVADDHFRQLGKS